MDDGGYLSETTPERVAYGDLLEQGNFLSHLITWRTELKAAFLETQFFLQEKDILSSGTVGRLEIYQTLVTL